MNLATADLFQAEIARLQAENERLRSRPCPYVTGTVTLHCTLTPLTLTDAEREAVATAIDCVRDRLEGFDDCEAVQVTLRGLLERLK